MMPPCLARQVQASAAATQDADDRHGTYVCLADGTQMYVPHANLAAAKELLAVQNAVARHAEIAEREYIGWFPD